MRIRPFLVVVALALILPGQGCKSGPPTGTVSGKVMVQGQPLTAGVLYLLDPDHGIGATAPLGPDGEFAVKEPLRTGTWIVFWDIPRMLGDPPPVLPANAPARDVNEQRSQVRVEVKPGPNTFTLELH